MPLWTGLLLLPEVFRIARQQVFHEHAWHMRFWPQSSFIYLYNFGQNLFQYLNIAP